MLGVGFIWLVRSLWFLGVLWVLVPVFGVVDLVFCGFGVCLWVPECGLLIWVVLRVVVIR